jgi:hypothetical protein
MAGALAVRAAGVGWAVAGAVVGAAAVGAAGVDAGCAGGGPIALTAFRHAPDSRAEFCCRQRNASAPPGVTLEQFDMKSERQLLRISSRCACVGCCATATPVDKQSVRKTIVALRTFRTGPTPPIRTFDTRY